MFKKQQQGLIKLCKLPLLDLDDINVDLIKSEFAQPLGQMSLSSIHIVLYSVFNSLYVSLYHRFEILAGQK